MNHIANGERTAQTADLVRKVNNGSSTRSATTIAVAFTLVTAYATMDGQVRFFFVLFPVEILKQIQEIDRIFFLLPKIVQANGKSTANSARIATTAVLCRRKGLPVSSGAPMALMVLRMMSEFQAFPAYGL